MVELRDLIREKRIHRKMTQKDLSEKLGVAWYQVSYLERLGSSNSDIIQKACEVLGIKLPKIKKGYVVVRGKDSRGKPLLFHRWNVYDIPDSVQKIKTACFSSRLDPKVFLTPEEARAYVKIPGMQVMKYG